MDNFKNLKKPLLILCVFLLIMILLNVNIMYALLGGVILGIIYYLFQNKLEDFSNIDNFSNSNNLYNNDSIYTKTSEIEATDEFYLQKDKLNINKDDDKIDYTNFKNRQFVSYDSVCKDYDLFLNSISPKNNCKNGIHEDCFNITPVYYQGKGGVGLLPSGNS